MNEKQQEKELKLGDWGVVDGSLMREILDNYLLNLNFSDKVLEIQRLKSITQKPRIRAFIGQRLKMKDYPSWNDHQMRSLKKLQEMAKAVNDNMNIPDFTESIAALCIWEDGPRITPIVREDSLDEENFRTSRIFRDIFGLSILSEAEKKDLKPMKINLDLSLWLHINEEGKYELPALKTQLEPKFRIRGMDYEVWKEITADYIKRGCVCPDYVEKDDISLKEITL